MALCLVPGRRQPLPAEEFLQRFGATDGVRLGVELLSDAIDRRDPVDVELALIVGFKFGFSDDHLASLVTLAFAAWHEKHEDVATALGRLRSPHAVAALDHLAWWVPGYLEFDDARALAVKAIWALGSIRSADAQNCLESLSQSECKIVAEDALAQLQK